MIKSYCTKEIIVKRKTTVSDGGGGFNETWSDHLTTSGRIRQLSSSEVYSNEARGVETSHRLYSLIVDIQDGDKIVCDEREFEVKGRPNNPMDFNEFLQTELKEL